MPQLHVCPCTPKLPPGFYWYGGKIKSIEQVPQWVMHLLNNPEGQSSFKLDEPEEESDLDRDELSRWEPNVTAESDPSALHSRDLLGDMASVSGETTVLPEPLESPVNEFDVESRDEDVGEQGEASLAQDCGPPRVFEAVTDDPDVTPGTDQSLPRTRQTPTAYVRSNPSQRRG